MSISIVRLGTARLHDEGLRIGTVRRPPRGVPKQEYAEKDYYDVWFPNLAPSADTMKLGQAVTTEKDWQRFVRAYKNEMKKPEARHDLALLAALSHSSDFSVGCYCEDEQRCHRSILRELLIENGAMLK